MTKEPNFLIIGGMKCGTTSLHDYLSLHPEIHVTTPKELHFFTQENYDLERFSSYLKHFDSNKNIAGSSPQNYTKLHRPEFSGVPERLNQHFPEVKLIYLIRNPIERLYSHYREAQEGGYAPREGLNNFIAKDIRNNHYVKTSCYGFQLKQFLQYFDSKQVLVVFNDELKNNRLKTVNKTLRFLGLNLFTDERIFDFESNTKEQKKRKNSLKLFMESNASSKLRKLIPKIIKDGVKNSKWFNMITHSQLKSEILAPHILTEIEKVFEEDKRLLESLLQTKITWK